MQGMSAKGWASMIQRAASVVPAPKRRPREYSRWIAGCVDGTSRVLNIGAGEGRSESFRAVMRKQPYVVGIDPHETVMSNATLDERYQLTMEDYAATHPERFDVAFSIYVLEHVADPDRFINACASVLKPGGRLFGLTLNRYQYFGFVTWATTRLGVSEAVLKRIKSQDEIDQYHFPTQYRLNTIGTISKHLESAGFSSVEFRCFDQPERYAWYLPKRLSGFSHGYAKAAYRVGRPSLMGHISFCAVK